MKETVLYGRFQPDYFDKPRTNVFIVRGEFEIKKPVQEIEILKTDHIKNISTIVTESGNKRFVIFDIEDIDIDVEHSDFQIYRFLANKIEHSNIL